MRREEFHPYLLLLSSWLGGWESINGNPDVYIFRGYDGRYYLLTYSYAKDYERGCFTCYNIDSDDSGCYVHVGMKNYRLSEENSPSGLCIGDWGNYKKY